MQELCLFLMWNTFSVLNHSISCDVSSDVLKLFPDDTRLFTHHVRRLSNFATLLKAKTNVRCTTKFVGIVKRRFILSRQ